MDQNNEKYMQLLLHYHDSQIDLLKHYEDQRTKISQILLTLASALIGLSKIISSPNVPITTISLLVIALGLAGIVFTFKYTSLANKRTTLARRFRKDISDMWVGDGQSNFETLYQGHSNNNNSTLSKWWQFVSTIKLRYCWIFLHLLIIIIGISLLTTRS